MADVVAYHLPKMSNSDVIQGINKLFNTELNEKHLTKPEPDVMRSLYEKMVESFIGVSLEELGNPHFGDFNSLEYPQLHEESVFEITFLRYLFKVMNSAGVNFKLSDMHAPTFARTKKILIAILNFGRHYHEKLLAYEKFNQERIEMIEKQNQVDEELLCAQDELINIKNTIANEREQVEEYKKKKQNMLDRIRALNETQAVTTAQIEEIKEENHSLRVKLEKIREQKKDLEERKARLKSRILDSPEKTMRELQELKIICEKEREALAESEAKNHDVHSLLEDIDKYYRRITKCLKLLKEITEEIERNNKDKNQIKESKLQIERMNNLLRELKENREHAEKQIASYEEKISRMEQQNNELLVRQKVSLDEIIAQKLDLKKRNAQASSKIKELELKKAKLEAEDSNNLRCHREFMNQTQRKLSELLNQVRIYHQIMRETMKS